MSISRLEAVVFLSTLELFVVPQSDRAVRLGSPLVLCRSTCRLAGKQWKCYPFNDGATFTIPEPKSK